MSGTTEESILSQIPDFQDEGASSGVEGGSGASQEGGGASEGSSNEGRSSAQPTQTGGESSADDRARQNQPPIRRRHDGLLERANPDNPNTRDLVDPVSGRVVATGGIERRVYEESQRTTRENN